MSAKVIRRALISVFNKTNLSTIASWAAKHNIEMISTGGTLKHLRELGCQVRDVSEVTHFPEMMDGRVKTLHPNLHAGILADQSNPQHLDAISNHGISAIDLVVCNLYPFEKVAEQKAGWDELIENIDIGGPSMIRAAAKNHGSVCVLSNPNQYQPFIQNYNVNKGTTLDFRKKMAIEAITMTAQYDGIISSTLAGSENSLRYGENPHQRACVIPSSSDTLSLIQNVPLQGKALSYNNLLDADAAVFALRCLVDGQDDKTGCVVIKHGTPCGAALGDDHTAVKRAFEGDPVSAFGGIIAFSSELNEAQADLLSGIFLEVIIAPAFSQASKAILSKKKNLRLLEIPNLMTAAMPTHSTRSILGGTLRQESDGTSFDIRACEVVTERHPSEEEWLALDLAFRMCKPTKSNAITLALPNQLIGTGAGQTSRIDSVRIAVDKARTHGHVVEGCALGSDAFFPFPDGVEAAAEAGVKSIIQPGGSIKDKDVIAKANELGLTMLLTGRRHFRH